VMPELVMPELVLPKSALEVMGVLLR